MSNQAPPIYRLVGPFRQFAASSASSGILLIAATVVALFWANGPFADSYDEFWHTELSIDVAGTSLTMSLLHWINDGLMAVFFLVVGLEIKREVLVGELASVRRATLPIGAAIGGAVVPALIYVAIAGAGDAARGWAIPMATDIAFALGVLALLGDRIPTGLRVFMAALAIVDDLIAVSIIGLFYTAELAVGPLLGAAACLGLLVAANLLGVRRPVVYAVLGIALWFAVLQSGVHATIAGVLLAMTIPSRVRLDAAAFADHARRIVAHVDPRDVSSVPGNIEEHHDALWELEEITERAQAPMLRFEHALQPWAAFGIVPLFALANAGVPLGDAASMLREPTAWGVAAGLVIGKQIGILAAVALIVRAGLAVLPAGVTMRHVYGIAWLGGIGFTMSLFISDLAFGDSPLLASAKTGILVASAIAGVGGLVVLGRTSRPAEPDRAVPPAARST